jgi:transposase-like protein
MPNPRPPYSPEFREKIVSLFKSGRSYTEISQEFGVADPTIRSWVQKSKASENPGSQEAIAMSENEELKSLRREVRVLREEREILKKAAAWFAQETGTPSSRRSSS